ncbi:hypothetical protein Taro_034644, partial [Colocasia esculenta]|nr:hypothetical protein [Colocasia esculenta]
RNSLQEKTRKPCSSLVEGCACIISSVLLPPPTMRIRRRARDVVQPSTTPSSPGFSLSAAPPVSSPRGSSPSRSGAAAPADVKLPPPPAPFEVDGSTWEATPLGPHPPPHGQDRQGEENERGDDATEKRKRGADVVAEAGHDVPAQVSSSTKANQEGQQHGEDEAKAAITVCKKGDGKGWRCKREAQPGCSLCQYHLAKLRSYSRKKKRTESATPPPETPAATTGDPLQRAARRRNKELGESKGAVLSGGFYYYSGFGPRWGKSRRDRAEDGRADAADGGASGARRHVDRLDDGDAAVAEEDYGHGDANGDGKPWKSRSLSSLL